MDDGINSTEDLLSFPSFRKWANGTVTKPDADKWDEWCQKSENNRRLAAKAQAELLGITPSFSEKENVEYQWIKVHNRLKNMQPGNVDNHRKSSPLKWGYRIAVALFVIAITGILSLEFHYIEVESGKDEIVWQEVSTTNAQQKKITLTDGSTIILSANSTIAYSDGWVQNSGVDINLYGEAYFDILSGNPSNDPFFKVRTSDGTVLVTGTRFVVDADEKRTRVVLEEGSVDIERNLAETTREKELISLQTDQLAEFNSELLTIKRVNPEVYTSWTRQELVLDSTPLSFLTDKISKTYGVNVKVDDSELYDRKLTGTINFRSMDRLLVAVSEVLEIEVTQIGNNVIFK